MSTSEIREPIQKRSIEKKEKIIKAGFELICKKGYYNTNTAQIAKSAGVSTGIVYQYFKDKHDILIDGLYKYADNIFFPMLSIKNTKFKKEDFKDIIKIMIINYTKDHKLSKTAHEEIMSMVHSDKDVANYYYQKEMELTHKIYDLLVQNDFSKDNLLEKVHIIIGIIENYCHEVTYHKHSELNYDTMLEICVNSIINILK